MCTLIQAKKTHEVAAEKHPLNPPRWASCWFVHSSELMFDNKNKLSSLGSWLRVGILKVERLVEKLCTIILVARSYWEQVRY